MVRVRRQLCPPNFPTFLILRSAHKNETKHKQAATEKQMTNFDLPVNRAVSTPRQAVGGLAVHGNKQGSRRHTTVQREVTTEPAGGEAWGEGHRGVIAA